MSIETVLIRPADDNMAPPEKVIELSVLYDGATEVMREPRVDGVDSKWYEVKYPRQIVLLSLSEYEEDATSSTLKRTLNFPPIDVNDLVRALSSFGIAVQSIHAGPPPTRVQAPKEEVETT